MAYTHQQFAAELAGLKEAAASSDPTVVAAAAAHARTLLGASGLVGSIVASRRAELQAALAACENAVAGAVPSAPAEDTGVAGSSTPPAAPTDPDVDGPPLEPDTPPPDAG